MDDYKKQFGVRLKEQRKKCNFTQEYMAEKLGISLNHYSEVERGLKGLSVQLLIKISQILDISLDFLLMGSQSDTLILNEIAEGLKECPDSKKALFMDIVKTGIALMK